MFTIFAVNKCALTMSPRKKTLRKVLSPPPIKGFNPYGAEAGMPAREPVMLMMEEYEALR